MFENYQTTEALNWIFDCLAFFDKSKSKDLTKKQNSHNSLCLKGLKSVKFFLIFTHTKQLYDEKRNITPINVIMY